MSDIEVDNSTKNKIINVIVILIMIALIVVFMVYKLLFNEKIQHTIQSGYIEKTGENQALILLKEDVVKTDENLAIVPIVEEGKRVSTNQVIAIYKNAEYDEYLSKIENMDMQIETLIKDLPSTFSADITSIEEQISKLTKESMNITSYIKMQEYKTKLDELSEKKVSLLSELSPQGSKIRELIEERKNYERQSKESNNNVKATSGGIVSYKIDGLENYFNLNNISELKIEDMEKAFDKFSSEVSNKFGLKLIDNYRAYILIKEKIGENDEYIRDGRNYTLRLIDSNYKEIQGRLVVHLKDDNYNYIIFEVLNNVEDIYSSRFVSLEIVWKKTTGLVIPIEALKHNEDKDYDYVISLKYGDYEELPIEVKMKSDMIAIIDKMPKEKKEELGLKDAYDIKLYDRIIIE